MTDRDDGGIAEVVDWSEFPLFAPPGAQIPVVSDPENDTASPALTALSHLLYDEETPEEASELLRDEGNRHFKRKGKRALHTAIVKYSAAVDAARGDAAATAASLNNRAAAELKLSNFGRALSDATEAARLEPSNIKAHFRAAVAATHLEKFEVATRETEAALALARKTSTASADVPKLQAQLAQIETAKRKWETREQRRQQRTEGVNAVDVMIAKRGLCIGKAVYAQQHEYARTKPRFVDGEWCWPVMLVYPTTAFGEQSDFVEAVAEGVSMSELIRLVFEGGDPPWWDDARMYCNIDLLEVRVRLGASAEQQDGSEGWRMDDGGELITLEPHVTIAKLLERGDYIIPLYPVLYIVPKSLRA